MKKTIALVIICLLTMSLTACGSTNTAELDKLRQEVSIPEEETTVSSDAPTEATESNTTTVENNTQMSKYLDNQVKSSSPDNWLEVANCDVATEKNLLEVAEKCASINYYYYTYDNKRAAVRLANALSENPNSTDNVMKTLTNSEFPAVWLVVANSAKSKEGALQSVAEKCASINYYDYTSDNEYAAVKLANALSKNPNSTDNVMKTLTNSKFPDVWLVVANSAKSKEGALQSVAEKCASINYYDYTSDNENAAVILANALSENSNSTDNVMKTLTVSKVPDVWLIVANSAKSKEGALQSVAEKCASINYYDYTSDNEYAAVILANALSGNPNSTKTVMQELVNSAFPDVVSIGHQWIEEHP